MEFKKQLDRYLLSILTPHPRHPLRTIIPFLAGLLWVGVLGNFLFSLISWIDQRWLNDVTPPPPQPPWIVLLVCAIAVVLLVMWSMVARTHTVAPSLQPPEEVPPPPMKGLILLLSYYSPRGGASFEDFKAWLDFPNKTEEEWRKLEEAAEKSNFDVPLQAIRYHLRGGRLRHVWLICTDDSRDAEGNTVTGANGQPCLPGSWRLAPYLEKFVHEAPHGKLIPQAGRAFARAGKVQFHYHRAQQPKLDYLVSYVGEQGARDVFKAVNFIFEAEVELEGLEMDEVICDFTGGRAPHTIGMAMACLPARRRIQYSSALQTPEGGYVGRATPREIRADNSWLPWFLQRLAGETTEPR